MSEPLPFRVGHGTDVHRLAPGRPLVLGGVRIEHDRGLLGHSDADVLVHAVIDAVLGAMALGDIGSHFPSSEERWRDADSLDLLRRAVALAAEAGGRPVQAQAVVQIEKPRLAPHVTAMRNNVAVALGVPRDRVAIQATTTDGLGFVGREEGVAASAVVLLTVRETG